MRTLLRLMPLFFLLLNCSAASADETKDALLTLAQDPSNPKAALSRLTESEDPKMIAALGVMFFDGVGVAINHPEAMPFLEKAAKLGRPEAQYRLGVAYSTWNPSAGGPSYYNDPPYDAALAQEWFRKARNTAQALKGDPAATTTLGNLYRWGRGGFAQDLTAAKGLFLEAAKQGYPEAEVAYGDMIGPPFNSENLKEKLSWFSKAAAAGSCEGLEGMGIAYLQVHDKEKALPFLRQAASLGREPASRFLYLSFKEKIGNNVILEMEKGFNAGAKARDMHALAEKLSDPVVMAATIIALSAVLGLATANPNQTESQRRERDRADYEKMQEDKQRLECDMWRGFGKAYYDNPNCH